MLLKILQAKMQVIIVPNQSASPQGSPNPRGVSRASTEGASMASSSRDRTAEFRSPFLFSLFMLLSVVMLTVAHRNTVRSLKGRNLNNNGHIGRSNGAVVATREASQFMDIARLVLFQHLFNYQEFSYRSIGKDITSTYTKLEKLTLLAKRKTIFDDKPVEIQELTYIIKQDIAHLNKQIAQLQTIGKYVSPVLAGFSTKKILSGLRKRTKASRKQGTAPVWFSNCNPCLQKCPIISSRFVFVTH